MSARRRSCWAAAATIAATALGISNAFAQGAVLAYPPNSSELRELQVAVATSEGQSTWWLGAKVEGAAQAIFVVVPAPPGSSVDLASDAWFEALSDATHPRIVPPSMPPDVTCPEAVVPGNDDYDLSGDISHSASVQPTPSIEVLDFSQLVLLLQDNGLSLDFEAMSTLADLDTAGYRFVVLRYEPPAGNSTLRTVRIASLGDSIKVPLLLSDAGATSAQIRVWAFSEGRANPGLVPWRQVDRSELAWSLAGTTPPTNYAAVIDSMLDQAAGDLWIVDAASHQAMFRNTSLLGGSASIPSVAAAYFDRAAAYGDSQADSAPCIGRVGMYESSPATVGRACAPGALAVIGTSSCVEDPQPGEIEPDQLRCGGIADDLALAMGGAEIASLWLTRWTGRLPAWELRSHDTLLSGDEGSESSVVVCDGWDTTVCEQGGAGGGTGGSGGASGSGGQPPNVGGGYGGGQDPYNPPPDDPYYGYDDYDDTEVYVEGSCWGDTSSTTSSDDTEDDSCSGDSSSSSAEEDESCTGDSSSSSTEDDEACAGDSSDASEEGDSCSGDSSDSSDSSDSCSGDSSDSSSSSDSCSGDSSGSSSSSDSCSGGGSSSSSSSDCAVSPKKSRKGMPTSAFAMLLAASALTARRLRRDSERRSPFR